MTATEYRVALAALNLSQVRAAALLGVDPRTSRKWALGQYPVPRMAALVLRLMMDKGVSADEANEIACG